MKSLFLTGFMGSGKTTIGKQLAEKLSLPVIDTDEFIENQLNKTIREIFETEGEKKFREYEKHFLKLVPTENTIVTTGGGIILAEENRAWMREKGYVIYLHCEPDEIIRRLKDDQTRPLLDGDKENNIRTIFSQRLPLYNEADLKIDTMNKNPDEIVEEIEQLIKTLE
ncbi:shikimate kinase [Calidifontibacillus erzurumensis]|uniref:Shikimate kinase n=1 Tax=Calidifontibacillus erzurumensis TaxID=2741433 RepID=A0A8J8GAY9_9BACI|nr:shikimate kinase [Calidifontibacillus erzurumensis]NSL50357.1 shikimate kinase [Calidifontibacillus erzurumensis]